MFPLANAKFVGDLALPSTVVYEITTGMREGLIVDQQERGEERR